MHNNAEVMYHLEFPQYTKQENLIRDLFILIIELLDDILVKYYEFVRYLLLQYISKQIDDHRIDTMINLISYFHSLV